MDQRTCTIDDCTDKQSCQKMCNKHYLRWKRYGDPGRVHVNKVRLPCSVSDCEARSHAKGLCHKHYTRLLTYGTTELQVRERKTPPPHIYLTMYLPLHVLAAKNGKVFAHRVVLFDAIGYGPHRCYWCRRVVSWQSTLVTDHLDCDRHNNDLSNLVVSCNPCNVAVERRKPHQPGAVIDALDQALTEHQETP